jgi:hypothetical protein
MVEHRESHGSGAGWLTLAVVAIVALLFGAASYAAEASPFMSITAWQKEKLAGTEFSTNPIKQKDEQYFLVRRLPSGELFERVVQKYCVAAGISAEDCKGVATSAVVYHTQEHTHKNWQVYDRIYLTVPQGIYAPRAPGR